MSTAGRRARSPYVAIVIGIVFVLVGVNYLLKNLGVFPGLRDDVVGPLVLIAIGIVVLVRGSSRSSGT
jgi:hypothetical protein